MSDEISSDSRAILHDAGEPPGPSDAARARMRRAIAAKVAGVASAAAVSNAAAGAGASAVSATGWSTLSKVFVAALVVLGGAGAAVVVFTRAKSHTVANAQIAAKTEPPPVTENVAVSPPRVAVPPVPVRPPAPAPSITVATAVPPPVPDHTSEPAVSVPAPARDQPRPHRTRVATHTEPTHTQPEPAPSATSLTDELNAIHAARAALSRHDASSALATLNQLAARFPRGTLREERRLLRVTALCALGQLENARAEARRLLAENPRSPQAGRVRASCVGAGL